MSRRRCATDASSSLRAARTSENGCGGCTWWGVGWGPAWGGSVGGSVGGSGWGSGWGGGGQR